MVSFCFVFKIQLEGFVRCLSFIGILRVFFYLDYVGKVSYIISW